MGMNVCGNCTHGEYQGGHIMTEKSTNNNDILLTPEQAIAATLGVGECEWQLEHSGTLYDKWRCSECGYLFVESRTDHGIKEGFEPNYCPNCGARVRG